MEIAELLPLQKIADASEGGQQILDVSPYTGFGLFSLQCKNDAGTNPTAAVKLQQGDLARGALYSTTGDTDTKLKTAAAAAVKLAAQFDQDGYAAVRTVHLRLKKIGSIAAAKTLTLTVEADNSGDPSGTALGTATASIDDDVDTDYSYVAFTFDKPVDLTDTETYWLVLTADYTASATDCVVWHSKDGLTSVGNASVNDGSSWTADDTLSFLFYSEEIAFADISGLVFTTVEDTASHQETLTAFVDDLKQYVRAHVTITGTSTPAFYVGVTMAADAVQG